MGQFFCLPHNILLLRAEIPDYSRRHIVDFPVTAVVAVAATATNIDAKVVVIAAAVGAVAVDDVVATVASTTVVAAGDVVLR